MMSTIIGGIGAVALGVFILINWVVVLSIRKLEGAETHLVVKPGGAEIIATGADYNARNVWAQANGFEPDMLADFHGVVGAGSVGIAVWKNAYYKTFLSSTTTPERINNEFVTLLSNDTMLTTSNAMDSALFPTAPGHFIQAYDGMKDLSDLHKKHEEGLFYLRERKGLTLVDRWASTDQLILEAIHRQIDHIKSIAFWQIFGAYWFFVRRYLVNNKSVAELYP